MTIQENVRTTTLVMIGRITRNSSTVCQRGLARAQIQAIGYPKARHRSVAFTPRTMVLQRIE
jgi:hypothetical protein